MSSTEAPEFSLLKPALKALVRRIGNIEEHTITSASGTPGKGWRELHDEGWVKIHEDRACLAGSRTRGLTRHRNSGAGQVCQDRSRPASGHDPDGSRSYDNQWRIGGSQPSHVPDP